MPTLPSQPARPLIVNSLDARRQSTRRRRQMKYSRNPIVDSPQYQAYRARQSREGNAEDAKWPQQLEMAFLDALIEIPPMGRRKFSYKGKPHGRNELIKEYLWIAYLQTLAPGQRPDLSMGRTRKQVSSHIQVLKGFLREHPAFDRLFPSNKAPKNGFEDSFKNDPCLRALSEGRLPSKRYDYDNMDQVVAYAPMRPVLFWLLITSSSVPDEVNGKVVHEEDLLNEGMVAHRFTGLSTQRQRDSLENISNWRQRFPYLQQLVTAGELQCDIIHMDVSLNLLIAHPPEGAELCCQTVLSFSQPHEYEWRIITTLNRPPELYRDPHSDPPVEGEVCLGQATSLGDGETRVKIPFPAVGWANAVTCLTNLQAKYDEKRKNQALGLMSNSSARPAREYVEQITMYQEVQSSPGPRMPFIRRAIIVWTFHQAHEGEGNGTHWRYLDACPPRRICMSPSPHSSHHISASIAENFNSWTDTPLSMHQNLMDPFVQGLVTPPHTASLQSPFDEPNYGYGSHSFDIPGENLSFRSNNTMDSEATLVDHDTAANIDHFISDVNAGLGDYDHHTANWLPATESFDADPAWANYSVPSSTPALGWDGDGGQGHSWDDIPDIGDVHGKMGWGEDEGKQALHDWTNVVGSSPVKNGEKQELHEWSQETGGSPTKMASYDGGLEQKLTTWIEENGDGDEKVGYNEIGELQDGYEMVGNLENGYPEVDLHCGVGTGLGDGAHVEKAQMQEWDVVDDGFDYASLVERLKA
ncbi:TEA-domain-containing protein [Hyaloscypha variabilis F]|uniref:TEA-domain-containing protein n=1 Tax=Hyaloscypha variabilis (strain UAMH 11265 / GT02V1 / F) TaxID=1149755 RepID=A0A2J6RI94_HYAVF|nr:TEA-domain-containing protein [Hyaloscypha variabilis F]